MRNNLLIIALFVSTSAVFAQKSLSPFHAVSIHGCMKVEMVKGNEESIKIEGDEVETGEVKVDVSKNELRIKKSWQNDVWNKNGCNCNKVRITLTYKSVNSFKTGWGAQVSVQEPINENEVSVDASSGSELSLESQAKHMELASSSGAILRISGKTQSVYAKATTGGEVKAYNLDSEDVEAKANTGGIVAINVQNSLDASAGTGGEVKYKGSPKHRSFSRSLGGEIHNY